MSSVIKERTISAATEKAIQSQNATFARLVSIGTSWTKVRVGMRLHMESTGANLVSTPRLAVGFCSGTANQFGDATTGHFVGVVSNSATWSFQAGPYYNTLGLAPGKRVGSTLTNSGGFASNFSINAGAAANTADRSLLFVDLTKGSPNFTINCFCQNSPGQDVTVANFLAQMTLVTPAFAGHDYPAGITIAVDEGTDGTLDAINVAWDRSTPFMEFCDIAVAILA